MKKLMLVVIIALVVVIMYQEGCFKDMDFCFGSKIVRILQGDNVQPTIDSSEADNND